jgi:hypothetical protein
MVCSVLWDGAFEGRCECSACSGCSACGEGIGVVSDGFGGWVSRGSPCGVELPCFARFWSRGFALEPTGYWSVGRPVYDWSVGVCAAQASLYQHSISVLGDLLNAFAGDLQLLLARRR